jgi:hypothetical protein
MENEEKDNRATGEELPPELIDPITLTLMVRGHLIWAQILAGSETDESSFVVQEDPVMLIQCGHRHATLDALVSCLTEC